MKKSLLFVAALLLCLLASEASAQPDTTNRQRSANSLSTFFIGFWGPFDHWYQDSARQRFGTFAEYVSDSSRFANIEDSIGHNAEIRKFWDYPTSPYPAHRDTVLGGDRGPFLDVLGIEPLQLHLALNNAQYMRFEFERHNRETAPTEYPGFLYRPGLTGRNVIAAGATLPIFLTGTSRATDTNAVELTAGTDSPGVFADSMWHNELYRNNEGTPHADFMMAGVSRKMLARLRVRIDQTPRDTNAILCIVTRREERDAATIRKIGVDTIRADYRFTHVNSGFDTIDIPFIRDTAWKKDGVERMFFRFEWPGEVSATFDYMELMTARIDTTDLMDSVWCADGNIGTDGIEDGLFAAYSAEAFLDSIPVAVGELISRIKQQYLGRVQYLRMGDEFPLALGLPFKRLVKLVRDSTGGQIEVVPFTVDSGMGWMGKSLPNAHEFNFEGTRRGLVDPHYFADPRMIFFDPYNIRNYLPLPKRTADTSLFQWESDHMPCTLPNHYTRENYLKITQYKLYHEFLEFNRRDRRWAERQGDSTRYGIILQSGGYPEGSTLQYDKWRPLTGPEIKCNANIATSCGASGLLLYLIANPAPGGKGPDGGIMASDGTHDSMYQTTFMGTDSARLWTGFKERYDTVRKIIPTLVKYGTALLNAKRLGDWRVSELGFASPSLLPFIPTSIRSLDDGLRIDTNRPNTGSTGTYQLHEGEERWWLAINDVEAVADTSNRTFVHISVWLDTTGGKNDTMLYITNMRTDDSYDTTEVASTIDRRFITMKLKAPHIIMDMIDTNGAQLDSGRLWTPYVGKDPEDSLKVWLLPGDGILVKLINQDSMQETRIAINYPKGSGDYNDHGRIVFNRPFPGVLDKRTASKWSIPSTSRGYTVGIPDTTTGKAWQDSLLYKGFHPTRPERWRHQHWRDGSVVKFGFKDSLSKIFTARVPQIATDSIAYSVVIKNDFEGITDTFKTRIFDPWFVDGTTLQNYNQSGDTLLKQSPFLPHIPPAMGAFDGADPQNYGGVFRRQNHTRDPLLPMYSLSAYNILTRGTPIQEDSVPDYTDWVFIEWATNDDFFAEDPEKWPVVTNGYQYQVDTIARINRNRNVPVIFNRDSAAYTARYKRHLAVYDSYTYTGIGDSGLCCNNQRKLLYIGRDSLERQHYRLVYSSDGRIYSAEGIRTGNTNASFILSPEVLLSEWDVPYAHWPAVSYVPTEPEQFHYVYQQTDGQIKYAYVKSDGSLVIREVDHEVNSEFATPVIGSVRTGAGPLDIVAYTEPEGIVIKAFGLLLAEYDSVSTQLMRGTPGTNTSYPTIWVDSCYDCSESLSKVRFWIAWQQDTTILHPFPLSPEIRTDIFASQHEVRYGSSQRTPTFHSVPAGGSNPVDVSLLRTPASLINLHPSLAGMRVSDSPSVQLKLAYEALHGPPTASGCQGINVVNNRYNIANNASTGWTNVHFLTSCNSLDKFYKPSIEVTRWQKLGGDTLVENQNWYSLIHQRFQNLNAIQHWAFDGTTQRISPANFFHGLQDPQIAVTYDKIDSNLYRQAVTTNDDPRWMISGWSTLFKLGNVDTLWGYHSITERDTSDGFDLTYGFGELGYDDGTLYEFDLLDRNEMETVDSTHSKEYFMRSINFTLPESSTLQWCPWVRQTNDSIFAANYDSVIFALDFYDTTGSFRFRIDSLAITDSIRRIESNLRTVTIDIDSSLRGYVVFSRVSETFAEGGAPTNIISITRLSQTEAAKRGRKYRTLGESGVKLSIEPNPVRDHVSVIFDLPITGAANAQLYDQLGRMVKHVFDDRVFSRGEHSIRVNTADLQEGVYILQFRYGNYALTERVIIIR